MRDEWFALPLGLSPSPRSLPLRPRYSALRPISATADAGSASKPLVVLWKAIARGIRHDT